ncbi:MAG: CHRD domain-containing protein [Bacteroidetes bacterium]|nr:CHRD domain-containing protein [Bacteroidota bacterium]HET6242889.1 CHRD domain-containing protein [Bacteroidia bacterium]
MRKLTTKLMAIAFICFAYNVNAGHLSANLLLSAKLEGAQEVPAVATNATGVASFTLNATKDTMCVNISVNGLSGNITGIHVHEGAMGVNGNVVTDLSTYVVGNRIAATLTGSDITPAMIAKYLKGMYYVNVHTAANPNGEIRGQLMLETDHGFTADLNGGQEVPPVTTSAYGLGVFNLLQSQDNLMFHVVVQGLSGAITGVHLHSGAMGVAGGVVEDLGPFMTGNVITGEVDPAAYLNDLLAGNVYINVHTAANPNGEIRGQLIMGKYLMHDAMLDGAQEVPSVTTNAMGVASVKLNATMDTLWYDVVADGDELSGAITGAHFHSAAPGVAGGVEINITDSINGNRIKGRVTGTTTLTTAVINKFLTGNMYLNLHTAANPNGEIRGQVYRLAREGYTFSMDGEQEIPTVNTPGKGSGFVSIDRNQDNAHFMFVYNGLSGASTGTHFHKGMAGQTGGVIHDLSSFVTETSMGNGAAFGYLKSTDTTPFTTASSLLFRKDSVYINVHTVANPNGEIRGDVMRGSTCFQIGVGIKEINNSTIGSLELFPNPASEKISVRFESPYSTQVFITVYGITGNKVFNETLNAASGINLYQMNLAKLDTGMYFIKINNGTNQTVKRFVKK